MVKEIIFHHILLKELTTTTIKQYTFIMIVIQLKYVWMWIWTQHKIDRAPVLIGSAYVRSNKTTFLW